MGGNPARRAHPRRLLPMPRLYDQWGRTIALSADGRTLVYLQSQSEGDVWMMTLSSADRAFALDLIAKRVNLARGS